MNFIENILDIVFPPVCGICNDICKKCLCDRCSRKINELKLSKVENYIDKSFYFSEHFYIFKYEKDIRELLLKYKFKEYSYLYKTFAQIFLQDESFIKFISQYDVITSVPIHKKRMKSRGYNQSELIAKEIAKHIGIYYCSGVLEKNKNIVAQSSLNKEQRAKNIQEAFEAGKNIYNIKNKRIAIFDDIFTTGATVNECSKILRENGIENIGVFTLAKD